MIFFNHKGLTIIESLISLLLLSFILISGINIYSYADEIMVLAAHKKMAIELANTKLENLKDYGYSSLPQPDVVDSESLSIGSLSVQRKTYTSDVDEDTDGDVDYKQVTVEVLWQETQNKSPRMIEMTTHIAP